MFARSILYLLTLNDLEINRSYYLFEKHLYWRMQFPTVRTGVKEEGGAQTQAEVGRSWLYIIKLQTLYSI